jgi:hypothetical protein
MVLQEIKGIRVGWHVLAPALALAPASDDEVAREGKEAPKHHASLASLAPLTYICVNGQTGVRRGGADIPYPPNIHSLPCRRRAEEIILHVHMGWYMRSLRSARSLSQRHGKCHLILHESGMSLDGLDALAVLLDGRHAQPVLLWFGCCDWLCGCICAARPLGTTFGGIVAPWHRGTSRNAS